MSIGEIPEQRPTLLLWGFMGSGKSTVGRAIAERKNGALIDLDQRVEERAGRAISAIFDEEGESGFRAREAAELHRIFAEQTRLPRVVALGGGALLSVKARRRALSKALVICLSAKAETIAERTAGSDRPLLAGDQPEVAIAALMEERAHAYAQAHHIVVTDGIPAAAVAEEIMQLWQVY